MPVTQSDAHGTEEDAVQEETGLRLPTQRELGDGGVDGLTQTAPKASLGSRRGSCPDSTSAQLPMTPAVQRRSGRRCADAGWQLV